jgi:protein O-mannosyl-transferase
MSGIERLARARPALLRALLLVAAVLLAYLPALRAGYVWDDDAYLTANRLLLSLDGLRRIWLEPTASPQYYPLVFTTFWLERHVFGLAPAGYHTLNVLLHAGVALLVWRVLARLGVPGAYLAGLLFALHPVHVESVAWISERKNVLSGVFYLLALRAYLRHLGLRRPDEPDRPGRDYWIALASFVCALLSKTVTSSLPVVIVLLAFWRGRPLTRAAWLRLLPFFALGAAAGLHTGWLERHHVGAQGADWTLTLAERWLVAGRALWFYAGKLAWPQPLVFIYPRWPLDAGSLAQQVYPLAAATVLVVLVIARRQLGSGPLVAALFFGVSLFPALGAFDVYPMRFSFVADHFQYLASIGIIALTAAVLTGAARRLRLPATATRVAAIGLLALLAMRTTLQASYYRDAETLWRQTLRHNPDCWMAQNNLSIILSQRGDWTGARALLVDAVRLRPDDADSRSNLGHALWRLGDREQAIAQYRLVLRTHPEHEAARFNLAEALAAEGQLEAAAAEFARVVARNPAQVEAQYGLGRALALLGRWQEALGPFSIGARARPEDAEAQRELAVIREAAAKAAGAEPAPGLR